MHNKIHLEDLRRRSHNDAEMGKLHQFLTKERRVLEEKLMVTKSDVYKFDASRPDVPKREDGKTGYKRSCTHLSFQQHSIIINAATATHLMGDLIMFQQMDQKCLFPGASLSSAKHSEGGTLLPLSTTITSTINQKTLSRMQRTSRIRREPKAVRKIYPKLYEEFQSAKLC